MPDRTKRLARLLLAMAWDRKTFKSRLLWLLQGALEHFYRVQFARLNGQTKWVRHWTGEVERMIGPDVLDILWEETKGRWDKQKAVSEVLQDLRHKEPNCITKGLNKAKAVYRLKKPKTSLPTGVSNSFYVQLEANVNWYLTSGN